MSDPLLSTEAVRQIGMILCAGAGGWFLASAMTDHSASFRIGCAFAILGIAFMLRALTPP